jgi:hypothetical protein
MRMSVSRASIREMAILGEEVKPPSNMTYATAPRLFRLLYLLSKVNNQCAWTSRLRVTVRFLLR